MTTPIGADVGKQLEAMRDSVINLLFIWIRFVICLADTLGDDFRIAFSVAGVLTILALHAGRVLEQVSAESTSHNVVKLLLDKLVALLLVNLFFLLSDSALSIETQIQRSLSASMFLKTHGKMHAASRFEREPRFNHHLLLRLLYDASRRTGASTVAGRQICIGAWWRCKFRTARTIAHLVCRDPVVGLQLSFDTLSSHFLGNI